MRPQVMQGLAGRAGTRKNSPRGDIRIQIGVSCPMESECVNLRDCDQECRPPMLMGGREKEVRMCVGAPHQTLRVWLPTCACFTGEEMESGGGSSEDDAIDQALSTHGMAGRLPRGQRQACISSERDAAMPVAALFFMVGLV